MQTRQPHVRFIIPVTFEQMRWLSCEVIWDSAQNITRVLWGARNKLLSMELLKCGILWDTAVVAKALKTLQKRLIESQRVCGLILFRKAQLSKLIYLA